MFWTTAAAVTVATTLVSGTWGLTHPIEVQGTAHTADIRPVAASCWVEKVHTATPLRPGDAEVICGDRSKRPAADTADIGQPFGGLPSGDCGWYAHYTNGYGYELEPVGCN